MFRSNTNIVGYLQKQNFFSRGRSPSPTPQSQSRFKNYNSNKTEGILSPQKKKQKSEMKPVPHENVKLKNIVISNASPSRYRTQAREERSPFIAEAKTLKKQPSDSRKQEIKLKGFESSRVQMRMCLQDLLRRITIELRSLEGAILQLTASLQTDFYNKLGALKNQILQQIQTIFTQTKTNFKKMITFSGEDQLKQMLQSKQNLIQSDLRLQSIKTQMDKNWKKAAAQILSEDLDQKIEVILKKSSSTRAAIKPNRPQHKQYQIKQTKDWQYLSQIVNSLIKKRCS